MMINYKIKFTLDHLRAPHLQKVKACQFTKSTDSMKVPKSGGG